MDQQQLSELLECSVCLEQLDDTSKVLPCQHTFCKRCLENIFNTKHELRCPECRFLVEMRVEDLPCNILLIRLLEGLKTQARGTSSLVQERRRDPVGSPAKADNSVEAVTAFARQQQQRQAVAGTRPCAKALYNYDAKEASDLTFMKGDIVYLRKQVDENWYHGEFNSQHGYFPVSYVQVITPLPSTIPQCKGLFDFNSDKDDDCLSFKKDEIVTVLRKVDENWLEGKKGDKIGIFPVSFVELNDPAKVLLRLTDKNGTDPTSSSSVPPITPVHPSPTARALQSAAVRPSSRPGSKEGSPVHVMSVSALKRHSLTNMSQNSPPLHSQALQRRSLDGSTTDGDLVAVGGQAVDVVTRSSLVTSIPPLLSSSPFSSMNAQDTRKLTSEGSQQGDNGSPQETSFPVPTTARPVPEPAVPTPYGPKQVPEDPLGVGVSTVQIYKALFNYKPEKVDELELIKGDYYSVSDKCLDGWFKGVAIKTSIAGVFPGNYVQAVKTHVLPGKPQPQGASAPLNPTISPPRPETSSSEAIGRSRARLEVGERRSSSADRGDRHANPPPVVPRIALPTAISKPSSNSSPSSPVLATGPKTTRYVRASKPTSPNVAGAKTEPSTPNPASSPVWKHAMSACATITPPNVVVGATGGSGPGVKEKEKKKDKEKMGLIKRLASGGKAKKPKSVDLGSSHPLGDTSINHSRSGSFPSDLTVSVAPDNAHRKTGSFDALSSPNLQQKPARPKPPVQEKYRCTETYPAQTELELDLKVGDIIFVSKKRDDGWYKGTLQRTGKTGLFPGSFVVKH
ncbi:E3 ubiquitin-protein ligase SH3RF3-like [Dreissena polymorpha]|uniref:E3 ubiquitin-protein ligase SH3RF3-like n=1 Tax=Dreissena polymorpha TaxID=45954 RepID=UPI002264A435|nr:E3 ubiquitin-protein ligase SH3RF3-like [Dreissena polymorpha]